METELESINADINGKTPIDYINEYQTESVRQRIQT